MAASFERRLVLVTGAGASRNLGRPEGRILISGQDGPPFPWDNSLTVPHLHLHGGVGWYREYQRGSILGPPQSPRIFIPYLDDDRYRATYPPAILYPDPKKDPHDIELGMDRLWNKFAEALETATHVLVVGHSLHDKPLLDALAEPVHAGRQIHFAICYHGDPQPVRTVLEKHPLFNSLSPRLISMDFQPEHDFSEMKGWINTPML